MSYTRDREAFIGRMASSVPLYRLREILAQANAHQRACEGDCSFPPPDGTYDDEATGKRGYWSRRQDRAERRIRASLDGTGWTADFQGDPRGTTVAIVGPDGHSVCVPSKGYPASAFR